MAIRTLLKHNKIVHVSFIKADGTLRHMICTQDLSRIPRSSHPRNQISYDEAQIRVWDVVAQEWRSMKEDRIKSFEEYKATVA